MSRRLGGLRYVAVLSALLLVACQKPGRDRDIDGLMRRIFDEVRLRHYDAFAGDFSKSILDAGGLGKIKAQTARFPVDAPTARRVVATERIVRNGITEILASDEYDYRLGSVLFALRAAQKTGTAAWRIEGFQWQSATASQPAANDFFIENITIQEYTFLVLAVGSPILMVAASVKVVRQYGGKQKWIWAIVAFAGIGVFRMNLGTDAIDYKLATIQLVGAGIVRASSRFAPWFVSATFPFGALLILTDILAKVNGARRRGVDGREARQQVDHFARLE
jgi:hypothetical protein